MEPNIGKITAMVNSYLTVSPRARQQSHYRRMDSLKIIVARIERRLEVVELKAATASKKAGLSGSAIYNLKRGAKGLIPVKGGNAATFAALAPVLKTTVPWLTAGEGPESVDDIVDDTEPAEPTVPLVGYVGAGAEAHFYAVSQGALDEVPAPPGSTDETVAVEIRGDSLGSLFDRWLVYYDDVRRPATDDLIGRLCVVGLADGRVLIKKLRRGKRGFYDLLSDEKRQDPIRDVAVDWAARVRQMVPR